MFKLQNIENVVPVLSDKTLSIDLFFSSPICFQAVFYRAEQLRIKDNRTVKFSGINVSVIIRRFYFMSSFFRLKRSIREHTNTQKERAASVNACGSLF
jgi:hypothetical protein